MWVPSLLAVGAHVHVSVSILQLTSKAEGPSSMQFALRGQNPAVQLLQTVAEQYVLACVLAKHMSHDPWEYPVCHHSDTH